MSKTPEEMALIAWCESKYNGYLADDYSLHTVKSAFLAGYQAGLAADRWIDVKERLPEAGDYVICIGDFEPIVAEVKDGEPEDWTSPGDSYQYLSRFDSYFKYWQPLPAAPTNLLKEIKHHEK